MAAYEYTAIGPDGRRTNGTISADTARSARKELRLRQLTPIEVHEARERSSGGRLTRRPVRLRSKDRVLATRQLAMLIQSGSPVEEALGAVASQAEQPSVRRTLLSIRSSVTEGYRFSEALAQAPQAFPPLYRSIVAAGESSGTLGAVMERLAIYLEESQRAARKVQAALIYPAVLCVVALAVISALMTFVVPRVVEQFDILGQELPPLTQAVIGVSNFMRSWGLALLVLIGASMFGWLQAVRQPAIKRRADRFWLSIPVIGRLLRSVNAARFARTFSTLLGSGAPVLDSLTAARGSLGNAIFVEAVSGVMTTVQEGGSVARGLRGAAVFPPLLTHMAASGETGGDLAAMMEKGAEYLEDEFEGSTTVALGLLEPLIIVLLGGVVALIVLSIMLPIMQLNTLAIG